MNNQAAVAAFSLLVCIVIAALRKIGVITNATIAKAADWIAVASFIVFIAFAFWSYVDQADETPLSPDTQSIPAATNSPTLAPPPTSTPTPAGPLVYQVHVRAEGDLGIEDARVTIQVADLAPLTEFTDSDGFARLEIPEEYDGKSARLIVEASGYVPRTQLVTLLRGQLPDTIKLDAADQVIDSRDAWAGDVSNVTRTPVPTPNDTEISMYGPTPTPDPDFRPVTRTTESGVEQVLVPGGWFIAGDHTGVGLDNEKPPHWVYTDEFWIDRYTVTNAQFASCGDAVCGKPESTESHKHEEYYGNPDFADYPVMEIKWEQAFAYCDQRGSRLPTEAEFEKAAGWDPKTATTFTYPWGEVAPDKNTLANFNSPDRDAVPGGRFERGMSPVGAYDMAGNLWHWVIDWLDEDYYSTNTNWINPQGPADGEYKVIKGGSWGSEVASELRIANRGIHVPHVGINILGFRCVTEE